MKFLFDCWKIFHKWAQEMWNIFQLENQNFVSPSSHVMHSLLFKILWFTKWQQIDNHATTSDITHIQIPFISIHVISFLLICYYTCSIYIGNWTEWTAIWSEIIRMISNIERAHRKLDLKSQVWFQTKIAWHKVQLPLYCIQFWNPTIK